jgi:hypothetical protein
MSPMQIRASAYLVDVRIPNSLAEMDNRSLLSNPLGPALNVLIMRGG